MKFTPAISKLNILRLIFAILFLCLADAKSFSQANGQFSLNESPLPAPTSSVMDYAGVLDADTKANLEKRIIALRDKTNPRVELAVAIVKTTGERPISDYALAVARGWGIGSLEDDNPSALLLVAIDDRKYFTQVSKDLQDELPDGLVGQLQRQYLVPAFKQGNYSKGVNDTIEAFIRTIQAKQSGEPVTGTTQPVERKKSSGVSFCGIVICLIVVFIIVSAIFGRGSKGSKDDNDRWRGGGFGGGGGSALPFIVGTILGSSLGGRGGSSSDWGGSSGGGDSWGGFGGGGDFDGGGAGGDW